MNWKRGLLRLWAVAAVLWVCVAFYSNDTLQRVQDVHDPYAAFSSPVAPRDLLADAPSPPAPPLPPGFYPDAPSAAAPLKTSIWPPLFDFAKLAFIPPLLLLALGYIGLWVGRGFKRSNADEK
jgi:hypothetical protein